MRSLCLRLLVSLALMTGASVHAQALPGGAQLGMSPQQLQDAVPGLQRVPRPVRMTGGLAGTWRGPPVAIGGVMLAPTFFFAEGELRRVEYVAEASADAYASLLAWGRATWGPELASQGSEGAYAAWTTPQSQAYLQEAGGARRAQLRLVIKLNNGKDASEL